MLLWHLSYFSISSISTLFSRACFDVLFANSLNNNNDLEILARPRSFPLTPPLDTQPYFDLLTDINLLLSTHSLNNRSVSFWGAGHRNLTLLSQLNYDAVSFIVDSAPFKHHHFTPVTHIPIISPSQFQLNPTDVLLLSLPGLYNEEVSKIVSSWDSRPEFVYSITENSISLLS